MTFRNISLLITILSFIFLSSCKQKPGDSVINELLKKQGFPKDLTQEMDCQITRTKGYNMFLQKGLITFEKAGYHAYFGQDYDVHFTDKGQKYVKSEFYQKSAGNYMGKKLMSGRYARVVTSTITPMCYVLGDYSKETNGYPIEVYCIYNLTPFAEYYSALSDSYEEYHEKAKSDFWAPLDAPNIIELSQDWQKIKTNKYEIHSGFVTYNKEDKSWNLKNFKSIRWSNSECPNGSIKLETSIPKSEDTINGTLNTDVNQNADSQNSKQQVDLAATADFILLPNSDDFKYFNIYDGLSIKNLPDYFNNIFDIRAIDNKINTLAEYKTILEINNVPQNSYAIRLKIPSSNIAFSNEHVSISDIDVVCVRKEKGNNKDWIVYQISYIVNLSDDVSERNGEIGDLIRNHVESEFGLIKNKAHYYDNGMVQYVASNKNYQFILTYGGENRTTGKPIISVAINYQQ